MKGSAYFKCVHCLPSFPSFIFGKREHTHTHTHKEACLYVTLPEKKASEFNLSEKWKISQEIHKLRKN